MIDFSHGSNAMLAMFMSTKQPHILCVARQSFKSNLLSTIQK